MLRQLQHKPQVSSAIYKVLGNHLLKVFVKELNRCDSLLKEVSGISSDPNLNCQRII